MTVYTVELQGHDGVGLVSFYLADQAYNTSPTDGPSSQHFHPALKVPANFEQSISVSGEASIGFGEIVIANAHGRFDTWGAPAGIEFSGRPCIVKALPDASAAYAWSPVAILGVVEDVDVADAATTISVRLYDKLLDLDKPLLTNRYAGTTVASAATAEGNDNLKGAIKKRCYGSCLNIEADLANEYDLIWQVSDKPVTSIAAYDGGLALTNDGNETSLANLKAASISANHYRTCLNASDGTPTGGAYVRFGGQPGIKLTFDVVAGTATSDRSAANIAKQILLDAGYSSGDLDTSAFSTLHSAASAVCGLRIGDEETIKGAIERVLRSVTGWLLPDATGRWTVGRIAAPAGSSVRDFEEWEALGGGGVKRVDPQDGMNGMPVWRVVTRYRYFGTAHATTEIAGAVTDARRADLLGPNVYREVTSEDASIKMRYPRAGELTIETCFTAKADAQAEGDRILALRKVKRSRWQFSVIEERGRGRKLAETVKLTMKRFLPSGQNFVIVRLVRDYAANKMTFDVWG